MNLSFQDNRPLESTVFDSSSGKPLFRLSKYGSSQYMLSVMQHKSGFSLGIGKKEEAFATVYLGTWKKSMIRFGNGQEVPLKQVLHGSAWTGAKVHLPDGSQATWKQNAFTGSLKLKRGGQVLVESHRKHYLTSGSKHMNLDVFDSSLTHSLENLAMVVLSFAILEERKREEEQP
ncbi:hypothetical protein BT69DRAFT_1294995 [Atractiella rhizophila]|nr:hypothetical protein BT69DRAFT_1294995 [Atractiella rhizophila]